MEGRGCAASIKRNIGRAKIVDWYPAPAKLNLFLHVLGRREDGYHLLQTLFRLIDQADRVGIAVRSDGEIRRVDTTPGVAAQTDLCLRAARLLRDVACARIGEAAASLGADLGLEKHLPIGGGLGGGSSDAATVLLILNRQWGLNLARADLMNIGLTLGADVPLFLFGTNALGEGVGERLEALALPPAWYLVMTPQVSVSTKEIFSTVTLTRDTKRLRIPPFFPGMGRNDLQPVTSALFPEVGAHLDWLSQYGDARMTGSGACVFAEFGSETEARSVQARLPGAMRGFVARGLDQHPLRSWAADA
ncbi:MAG: 4-(cytidine 5'-diphospho)-2-C-methyl-D-erythritol kinase [Betaproteobacteria bacterium]|nr:4-(cytidine 5'-diphospho)-2-C-methyl-D-erythritol kinase [Betaproteobacteria bacterium]